jgi:chromate transporter
VRRNDLLELAGLFLKLGTIGFGGPAAHIAMMEDEVVRRRRWLSRDEFLDLVGATNLIPGPNSTELAIHVGHRRAGVPGLIVAGVCFIFPAAAVVTAIAWAYVKFGALPGVTGLLYGVKPVVLAVIVLALWRFSRTAIKTPLLAVLAASALVLSVLGANELAVIFGGGAAMALIQTMTARRDDNATLALMPLFLFFLKVGSILFGSGYVLLVFLRADLVERWHWLTESQLLDAIAVGQITPGPVFTTATFIGYVLAGVAGAAVATLGIFLPAFAFVAASGPLVPRLRRSAGAGAFLDGVIVASLALMAIVTWQLGKTALTDGPTIVLASIAVLVLFRYNVNSGWLVAGGAVIGLLLKEALPWLGR